MVAPRRDNVRVGIPTPVRTGLTPIGPEGGSVSFRLTPQQEVITPLLAELGGDEIVRRLSVLEDIRNQGRASPAELAEIQNLQDEMRRRSDVEGAAAEQRVSEIFGGLPGATPPGTAAAPSAPAFNMQEFIDREIARRERLRGTLGEQFGRQRELALEDVQEQFIPLRERFERGQAALGSRLTSPVSNIGRRRILEAEQGAIADVIAQSRLGQAAAETQLAQSIADAITQAEQFAPQLSLRERTLGLQQQQLGLQRAIEQARLGQQARQFGRTAGLEERKFGEQKRQISLADLRNQQALELSERLGRMQAEASKPGLLGQISSVVGGIGGLAGGVGGLAGGLGALKTGGALQKLV